MRHVIPTLGLVAALVLLPIRPIDPAVAPYNKKYDISYAATDITCLAKNIYHEARGETRQGKVAVAQVTLNRALRTGASICNTVYRKAQFSWTNSRRLRVKDLDAWSEAEQIAKSAMSGRLFIEGFEATYYHTKQVAPYWRTSRTYIRTIGNHIFYI